MGIVRFPYRWTPGTIWQNLSHAYDDIIGGIRNVLRWTPVIWHDADYDWEYLAKIMEYKLWRMADHIGNGCMMSRERDAKRMRICATILKRLQADDYFRNSEQERADALRAVAMAKAETELLGRLIGKHLRGWWD